MSKKQPVTFPALGATLLLTLLAAVLYLVADRTVPAAFSHPQGAGSAVNVMAVVVWCSSLIGLVPVVLAGARGVRPIVVGYFVGAAARVLICLVAAVVCVKAFGMPVTVVMVTLVAMYLPMLFLEAACVCRYLWRQCGVSPGGIARLGGEGVA